MLSDFAALSIQGHSLYFDLIFFVVDQGIQEIIILRVLKDRQNWKAILSGETDYRL